MKRRTKQALTTFGGCVLGGITLTGPLAGDLLQEWQCKRGLCDCHPHRYKGNRK